MSPHGDVDGGITEIFVQNHLYIFAFGIIERYGHRFGFQTDKSRLEFSGGNHRLVTVVVDGEAFRIELEGGGEVDLVHADAALELVRQFFGDDIDDFLLDGRHEDERNHQEVKGDEGADDNQGDS